MGYNRFYLNIIFRIILISANSFLFILVVTETNRPATTLFLGLLLILQTGNLIYYVNRINRQLANFIITLKEKDTSVVFLQKNIEKNFRGVSQSFQKIISEIQDSRIEKEKEQQKIKILVEHLGIGLMAINEIGKIEIFNRAASELLQIHPIHNLSELEKPYPELCKKIDTLKPGKPILYSINVKNKTLQLSIKTSLIKTENSYIKIISLQNIREELEAKELDSWKKLIRVITHEIMNTLTPVTTLTTAIRRNLSNNKTPKLVAEIEEKNINDTLKSAEIIEERSKGLISFIDRYRSITRLPEPKITTVFMKKVFTTLEDLFKKELEKNSINFTYSLNNENFTIEADQRLLEQVLINLVKNSLESLKNKKRGTIHLTALKENSTPKIKVTDNGIGISHEALDSIFVPFFTTKENGDGIGLSLAREIMRMHGGSITAISEPGKQTEFTLTF
ncbi:MAG: ATP-binding protein [Bacteroidales bacterium]|nr:ATP-binding protein [Bacteroidales bacterium]